MYHYPSLSAVAFSALTFLYVTGAVGARPVQPDTGMSQTPVYPPEISTPEIGPATWTPIRVSKTITTRPYPSQECQASGSQEIRPKTLLSSSLSALQNGIHGIVVHPEKKSVKRTVRSLACRAATKDRQYSNEPLPPSPDLTKLGCLDAFVEPCPADPTGVPVHCKVCRCGAHLKKGMNDFLFHLDHHYPGLSAKTRLPYGLFSQLGFGRPRAGTKVDQVDDGTFDARSESARRRNAQKTPRCLATTESIKNSGKHPPAPPPSMRGLKALRAYWRECPTDPDAIHCNLSICGIHWNVPEKFRGHLNKHYPKPKENTS